MPRAGGIYSAPAGTTATSGTTIESAKYNALVADLVTDANAARPITAGGTGATTAVGAADNLSPAFVDMASATTCDIGAASSPNVNITGTTTIAGFGTKTAGVVRHLKFAGVLTLTHNATSLILLGGVSRTTAAGDVGIYVSEGSGNWRELAYNRATSRPGPILVQAVQSSYTANADLTGTIPLDDTIPQNSEGSEFLTVTITPTSTANHLRVRLSGMFANAASGDDVILALFYDSVANAIYATSHDCRLAGVPQQMGFEYVFGAPASTSAITFKIRAGSSGAGPVRANGTASARLFGGVASVRLIAEEYVPT